MRRRLVDNCTPHAQKMELVNFRTTLWDTYNEYIGKRNAKWLVQHLPFERIAYINVLAASLKLPDEYDRNEK